MRTSHSVFQKVIRPSTGCARGRGPWRPTCATGSPCAGLGTRDPVTPPRPRPYLLVLGGPLQARGRPRGHASGAQGPLPGCPRPRVPAAPPPRPGQCGPDTRAGPSCGAGMLMRATVAAEEALWASGPSAGKPFRRPLSPGNPLRFPPPRSPQPAPHQPCAGLDPAASLPGDQAGGDGSVRVRNGGERGARRRGALVFSSLLSLSGRQEVRCRSPCGETSMVSDLCGRPVLSLSPPGRFFLSSLQPQSWGQLLGRVPSALPQSLQRRLPCGRTYTRLAPVLLQAPGLPLRDHPPLVLCPSPSKRPSFPLSVRPRSLDLHRDSWNTSTSL